MTIVELMTPEELQKQWFEMWNKTMKGDIFDMTKMTGSQMDDFMRLNLMKYLEYTNPTTWGATKGKLGLDDRNRICNAARVIKRELAEIERLVGQGDDSGV